ncbi:hypothetical protein IG631_23791 [Alternaria alternata]|nr:hypothetical protein IG631_23791 [Alternaria alternata]
MDSVLQVESWYGSLTAAQPGDEHSAWLPTCRRLGASRLRWAVDVQRRSLQARARRGGGNTSPLIG